MNLNESESEALAKRIADGMSAEELESIQLEMVLCPSHLSLSNVSDVVRGTGISLGAQDSFWEDRGAYTGEISPVTLKELGSAFCIVGHSERRQHLNETDEIVNRKAAALLRHDISPVICVGETREERDAGQRDAVVIRQVRLALGNGQLRPIGNQRIIIAYEPVWVIGTGAAVDPHEAAEVHQLIREELNEIFPVDIVEKNCFVIYGGSVDSSNIKKFLDIPVIEGALVGGASLKSDEFVKMAKTIHSMRV
jgi:triosephosphate isomerase (TIM)